MVFFFSHQSLMIRLQNVLLLGPPQAPILEKTSCARSARPLIKSISKNSFFQSLQGYPFCWARLRINMDWNPPQINVYQGVGAGRIIPYGFILARPQPPAASSELPAPSSRLPALSSQILAPSSQLPAPSSKL